MMMTLLTCVYTNLNRFYYYYFFFNEILQYNHYALKTDKHTNCAT